MTDTDGALLVLGVMAALQKMLGRGWLNVCTIRDAAETLYGQQLDSDAMEILRTVHCVDWADMPEALRRALPGLLARCLPDVAVDWEAALMPREL